MKSPPYPPEASAADGAEAEKDVPGRTRVRTLLIEPLEAAGMRRKGSVTAEAHRERLGKLAGRLAHMTPAGLDALRQVLARLGDGPRRDVWPSDLVIHRYAEQIERPPPGGDRLLTSYMRSAGGREAWERSPFEAAELARYLVQYRRPPPGDAAWRSLKERAAARAEDVSAAERRRCEGRASDDDLRTMDDWEAGRARVHALVFPKGPEMGVDDAA